MKMKRINSQKTARMVILALLAAVEIVLTLLYIPIGTINLNFGLTSIILTAVVFGPLEGFAIGAVSGLVTGFQVLTGQSVFYLFLVSSNPVAAFLLCLLKTSLAGLFTGLLYRFLEKVCKIKLVNLIASSALCPIVNTGLFALVMLTVFGKDLMNDAVISTWASGSGLLFLVFVALIGVNFFVEFAVNVIVGPSVIKAVQASKLIK